MQSNPQSKHSSTFMEKQLSVQNSRVLAGTLSKHSHHSQQVQPTCFDQNINTKHSMHTVQGQNVPNVSDVATKHISSEHPSKSVLGMNVNEMGPPAPLSSKILSQNCCPMQSVMSKNSNAITAGQVMDQPGVFSKQLVNEISTGSKVQPTC